MRDRRTYRETVVVVVVVVEVVVVGVSRQAISFLFASTGAGLVSPADQTPFPLIKSFEIFHLSVSRPRRVAAACSQPCLLTVSFSNLHQTLTTSSCP